MKLLTSPATRKVALFGVALAATGLLAGSVASAHGWMNRECKAHGNRGDHQYMKDQCKDGGWKSPAFASLKFKNQGDCVSYFTKHDNAKKRP